ncbi:MAG: ATP-binding protein [Bacteroidetes bacterium]|nr:ATP-binding protein [Bacteroidota bacterium]
MNSGNRRDYLLLAFGILVLTVLMTLAWSTSSDQENYSSEKFKQFLIILQNEFSSQTEEVEQTSRRIFGDSVLTSLIRDRKWEMVSTVLHQYPREFSLFVVSTKGKPLAWTGLTNDLLEQVKLLPYSRVPVPFQTQEAVYLIAQKSVFSPSKEEFRLVVFKVLGYSNLYYPSSAVPPSLAASLAGELSLKSVPLVSLSGDRQNVKHPVRLAAGVAGQDSVFFNFDLDQLNLALDNSLRTYRQMIHAGVYLAEFSVLLIVILLLFRLKSPRNLFFAQISAVYLVFCFLNSWLSLSSVFFPAEYSAPATYISRQTFGIFPDFISWLDFGLMGFGAALIILSFEFPKRKTRPGPGLFLTWIGLASFLISVSYLFITEIIGSLFLDGFVSGLPLDVSLWQPAFWLLVSFSGFFTLVHAGTWVIYKGFHISFLKKGGALIWSAGVLVSFLIYFGIQVIWNPNLADQIWFHSIIFGLMLLAFGYSVLKRLRWRHNVRSFFQYGLLLAQGFIPVFFLFLHLLDTRLDVLQKNYAVKLTNPNDGWFFYLTDETTELLKDRILQESVLTNPDGSQQGFAYSVWLQSTLSRERLDVRIRVYESELNLISEWRFGSLPPASFLQDSLATDSLKKSAPDVTDLRFQVRENGENQIGLIRTVAKIKSGTDSLLGFFILDVVKPKSRTEISQLGLLSAENEEFSTLHFSGVRYEKGTGSELMVLPLFPSRLDSTILRQIDWYGQAELLRTEENKLYRLFFYQNPKSPDEVWAVARMVNTPVWYWNQFSYYLLLLIFVLLGTYFLLQAVNWYKNGKLVFSFRERVFAGIITASLVPFWLLILFFQQSFQTHAVNTSKLLLENYYKGILPQVRDQLAEKPGKIQTGDQDYLLYKNGQVLFSTRPEWIKLNLMPDWSSDEFLPERSGSGAVSIRYQEYFLNDIRFIVGYYPVPAEGNDQIVLAIPNLLTKQQAEGEIDSARSYLVGGYVLFILFLVIFLSAWINWLLKPLKIIENAFTSIGRQKDPVFVEVRGVPEMEEFARSFNKMVGDLNRYKTSLASAERQLAWQEMAKQVAHEIKNPLNPLKLNTQLLISLFQTKNPKFEQVFEKMSKTILNEIETIDRIAKTFATYSRMPERNPAPLDLFYIAGETARLYRSDVVEIELTSAGEPGMVLADKDEMSRVFNNLIKNAVQAGKKESARIEISFTYQPGWLKIAVLDFGKGIPSNLIKQVLEPNFSTKTDGMGLGLSICRKVIQDMRGDLQLSSQEGEWTRAEILLPVIS